MTDERYERECPDCGRVLWYLNENGKGVAQKHGAVCSVCRDRKAKQAKIDKCGHEIVELCKQGKSIQQIRNQVGLSISAVSISKYLESLGLKLSGSARGTIRNNTKPSGKYIDKLKRMFEIGLTNVEIGDKLRLLPKTVGKYRARLGFKKDRGAEFLEKKKAVVEWCLDDIVKLHTQGLTNIQIQRKIRAPERIVESILEDLKLKPNRYEPIINDIINEHQAVCHKCGEVREYIEFITLQTSPCDDCRKGLRKERVNGDIKSYFTQKLIHLKVRAKKAGVPFEITADELVDIFNEQKGRCFYTGKVLVPRCDFHGASVRHAMSVDKVLPQYGYVKDNVVLCTFRANTVKQDMTLNEMCRWFHPRIYEKVLSKVFNLIMQQW